MPTNEADEFDYLGHMRGSTPEANEIRRGTEARQARRARSKERITIRIDQDVLEGFKDLSPHGLGYQSLMNDALRDWLSAQSVKALIRGELQGMTKKVVAAVRESQRPEAKTKLGKLAEGVARAKAKHRAKQRGSA